MCAQLPVTYFVDFFLESFALKEDEKRRLVHVRRVSLTTLTDFSRQDRLHRLITCD